MAAKVMQNLAVNVMVSRLTRWLKLTVRDGIRIVGQGKVSETAAKMVNSSSWMPKQ